MHVARFSYAAKETNSYFRLYPMAQVSRHFNALLNLLHLQTPFVIVAGVLVLELLVDQLRE